MRLFLKTETVACISTTFKQNFNSRDLYVTHKL